MHCTHACILYIDSRNENVTKHIYFLTRIYVFENLHVHNIDYFSTGVSKLVAMYALLMHARLLPHTVDENSDGLQVCRFFNNCFHKLCWSCKRNAFVTIDIIRSKPLGLSNTLLVSGSPANGSLYFDSFK